MVAANDLGRTRTLRDPGTVLAVLSNAGIFLSGPENYKWDDLLLGQGRLLRLVSVVPWIFALAVAIRKRNVLALGGIAWAIAALPPIAFIHQAPFPRHYYIALPGIAVFFASVVLSRRIAAVLMPMMAVVSALNVALYADQSWVAMGSRMTRQYLSALEAAVERTDRTEFYVAADSDPHFYWHIDGGAAVPYLLGKNLRFQFESLQQPIPIDSFFKNRLNIVTAVDGDTRRQFRRPSSCDGTGSPNLFVDSRAGGNLGQMYGHLPKVKANPRWRVDFGGALKSLIRDGIVQSGFGVYTGSAELKDDRLWVLPIKRFLEELSAGNILT